ncbi:BlaI/MecI/CopY family transcriptional regulator [Nonomuraea rubra]|uniref:BlaI/MecI/CopY family transcriptional regulator n=1 Tax=Nonomuraea rubra TaxID=46180 RepID=UPI0031EAC402
MKRPLGELEATIMDRMWSYRRPASVRDVLEDLRTEREIAYTTVMTVMDKLHTKGLLRREPVGRAYVYEPVATKEAYTAELMRHALAASGNQAATLVPLPRTPHPGGGHRPGGRAPGRPARQPPPVGSNLCPFSAPALRAGGEDLVRGKGTVR